MRSRTEGVKMDEAPYIEKQVVKVVRLYNPNYGDKRICLCGHTYERHFDRYEDPDHQDVGCKYCHCHDFIEAIAPNLELRALVICEFAGVGACSPEIYGSKLAHIASCLGRTVDGQFINEVSDIIRTLLCPLD